MARIGIRARCATLLGLLGLAAAFTALGEEPDYSKGMLDRASVLAAAKDVTCAKYPDAKEAIVAELERVRYAADGTYVQWHEQYIKVLTEEGRRDHLVVTSSFTIPYQRGPEDCRIPLIEIVKPDGRALPVDQLERKSRVGVTL